MICAKWNLSSSRSSACTRTINDRTLFVRYKCLGHSTHVSSQTSASRMFKEILSHCTWNKSVEVRRRIQKTWTGLTDLWKTCFDRDTRQKMSVQCWSCSRGSVSLHPETSDKCHAWLSGHKSHRNGFCSECHSCIWSNSRKPCRLVWGPRHFRSVHRSPMRYFPRHAVRHTDNIQHCLQSVHSVSELWEGQLV